ncbi:hypothetical protein [Arthrobacter sp. ES1]|uniref:hypothetical protein n=1 Tax=Arthrobacter sp. ES1 TaxID=1897056 RepID=UPI001CFF6E2B|nr:hypothetical protein [Arthrobacter sp. ES1]MCB5280351.1 hypothetical protein [Arthrobacter sp. ES1]
MGAFDDLLSKGAPEPEVNIYLPGKVGTVDKGGDAAQAAATAAGKPSDSQAASAAPEPEPQLPEGSDPDDPDTTEDDEADAAAAGAAALAMFQAEPSAVGEAEDDPDDDLTDQESADDSVEAEAAASGMSPMQPLPHRKVGVLSFEGEHSHLKHFPKALIEILRELLKVPLGDVPARDLSQNSVVTAFVIAALGVEFSADDSTMGAVAAFKANDPRTEAIEQRTATLLEKQTRTENMLKAVLAKLGDVTETAAVLEMGQAYALAERTAQLDTSGTLPETIDVTQKRAVAARDNIRRRVKSQVQDEKIRSGRPIR